MQQAPAQVARLQFGLPWAHSPNVQAHLWGALRELDVARNQYCGPGQVQRLVRHPGCGHMISLRQTLLYHIEPAPIHEPHGEGIEIVVPICDPRTRRFARVDPHGVH